MSRILMRVLMVHILLFALPAPHAARAQLSREAVRSAPQVDMQPRTVEAAVSVESVDPDSMKLTPGAKKSATIKGGGLNRPGLSLQVQPSAGGNVTANFSGASASSSRGMTVTAGKGAAPGAFKVVLKGSGVNITLPLTVDVVALQVRGAMTAMKPAVSEGPGGPSPPSGPAALKKEPRKDLRARVVPGDGKKGLLKERLVPAPEPGGAQQGMTPAGKGSANLKGLPLIKSQDGDPKPGPSGFGAMVKKGPKVDLPKDLQPMSADSADISLQKLATSTSFFNTILTVQQFSGDFEKWGVFWQDTPAMALHFRWKSTEEDRPVGRWEISLSPGFQNVIRHGSAGTMPEAGQYTRFKIDFRDIAAPYTIPATFFVRVKPVKFAIGGGFAEESTPSLPVRVTIAAPGNAPPITLPQLTVIFDRIKVIDDSDDLSGGEVDFQLQVEGAQDQYHKDHVDSGNSTHPNKTFLVEDPDHYVTLRVYGCDNDDFEGWWGEEFSSSEGLSCGSDPDTAEGTTFIFTGTGVGVVEKAETPFTIKGGTSATALEFEVYGRYSLGTPMILQTVSE